MRTLTPDDEVASLAARAGQEGGLSREEAVRLCGGDPLTLGALANERRRTLHENRVSLVRVHVFGGGAPGPDGADEIRMPPAASEALTLPDVRGTLDRVRATCPGMPVRWIRPAAVGALAREAGLTPRLLLGRLADAGLSILDHPAAGDDPAATREGLLAAHGAGLATDAPLPYRARMTPETLADLLLELRALPGAAERFRCAVPLPSSRPDESPLTATTGLEDLRVVACARILLPATVRVAVEIDALGPKLGAVALSFGADTLAGAEAVPTERLSPKDAEKPRTFNVDRARLLLAEAGRVPVPPPPFPARDA